MVFKKCSKIVLTRKSAPLKLALLKINASNCFESLGNIQKSGKL